MFSVGLINLLSAGLCLALVSGLIVLYYNREPKRIRELKVTLDQALENGDHELACDCDEAIRRIQKELKK